MKGVTAPGSAARNGSRPVITAAQMWADLAKAAWRQGEAAAAAGDLTQARHWLERARRITPTDAMVALSLALVCLRDGDAVQSAALFESVVQRYDVAEAWTGLAAAAYRAGQSARAAQAMQAALSRHVAPLSSHALAAAIGQQRGWCAMDAAGRLHADRPATVTLDGAVLRLRWTGSVCRPPPGRSLAVTRDGVALLGSPIDLTAIAALEGFVKAEAARWWAGPGIRAIRPRPAPHHRGRGGRSRSDSPSLAEEGGTTPLGRRRRFRIEAADLPPGLLHVTGTDGRDSARQPAGSGGGAAQRRRAGDELPAGLGRCRRHSDRAAASRRGRGGGRWMWWCRSIAAWTIRSPAWNQSWRACRAAAGCMWWTMPARTRRWAPRWTASRAPAASA
ncbi:MAG: hypothetical protein WDN49_22065 [Acetobacteraceae bacterium]